MNEKDVTIGEILFTDIEIDNGKFYQGTSVILSDDVKAKIVDKLKETDVSRFYRLEDIEFMFRGYQDVNHPENAFGEKKLIALAPLGTNDHVSLIQNVFLYGEIPICDIAEHQILSKFGKDTVSHNFSLENKINTICDIAANVLDFGTNERRIVDFWDVENDKYASNAVMLTVSLDEEYGEYDVYEIKVTAYCDGTTGEGYITSTKGTEELEQALYGIANGTCMVHSYEFGNKDITCSELQYLTTQKFNNEQLKAYKEQQKMDIERD